MMSTRPIFACSKITSLNKGTHPCLQLAPLINLPNHMVNKMRSLKKKKKKGVTLNPKSNTAMSLQLKVSYNRERMPLNRCNSRTLNLLYNSNSSQVVLKTKCARHSFKIYRQLRALMMRNNTFMRVLRLLKVSD